MAGRDEVTLREPYQLMPLVSSHLEALYGLWMETTTFTSDEKTLIIDHGEYVRY
jgi:hypothetical protein